jgi:hypothetical protein
VTVVPAGGVVAAVALEDAVRKQTQSIARFIWRAEPVHGG